MDSRQKQRTCTRPLHTSYHQRYTNHQTFKSYSNLTKQEREALKNLTGRNDIGIKPADKGKVTVETEKYKVDCYRELNNPKFYKRLPKGITH